MTQTNIDYQLNPRFVPDDLPLWLGNAKDSALIYDATADELTLQTQNASAVLTDRIRVESGTNTPFVEFVAGRLRLLDAAADPGAAGEISRNGADIKVYSGGAIRSLSDIGSGLSNVVEDTTPQLGGTLDVNGQTILFDDNENLTFGTGSDGTIKYDSTNLIIDPQVVGGGNVVINAGSIDLNNQGSLLNIGNAGSDWTDGALSVDTSTTGSGSIGTGVLNLSTSSGTSSGVFIATHHNSSSPADSSGPHHQDSGEAKIRESTAGVSRKPSSDCKACGSSSKHLCGLTAWNT